MSNLSKPVDFKVSVVIPSLSGEVEALLASLREQTWPPDEVEVVVGVRPNGRARNVGVSRSTGDIIIFIDDDALPGNERLIEQLATPLIQDATIHITGASKLIPPDSSWFQRWVAREIPRIEHPIVTKPLESNPDPPHYYCEITTTCCAIRRGDFSRAGGFNETLIRGVDTEFFVRIRRQDYRFILVPNSWTWHPAPATLGALWHKHFLYGLGHAQEVISDPTRAKGLQSRPFLYFVFRTLILIPNIFIPFSYAQTEWQISFKPLKAVTSYAGVLGFTWQLWREKRL